MSWHYIIRSKIIVKMMIKATIDLEKIYISFYFYEFINIKYKKFIHVREKKLMAFILI